MSYILDALKKAERQRRQESNSDLLISGESEGSSKKRVFWPYILIVALLLNAGIFLALFGQWNIKHRFDSLKKEPQKTVGVEAVKERFDLAQPLSPLNPDSLKPGSRAGVMNTVPLREAATPEPAKPLALPHEAARTDPQIAHEKVQPDETKYRAAKPKSVKDNTVTQQEIKPAAAEEITSSNRIYKLNELPQPVRDGLPDLSMSLHFYNIDPTSRLINVSGKTMKEGQELSSGLRLEQITPEGAVFSFKNYRFQVGLNNN